MEAFLKADTKQRKQSGTEEEFKEKEELMESLREKFAKRYSQKQASLSAKQKEKEDRERGEQIRGDALLALKDKRNRQEDVPQKKKTKIDLEQVLEDRREQKSTELKAEREGNQPTRERTCIGREEGQSARGHSAAKSRTNYENANNDAAANGTDGQYYYIISKDKRMRVMCINYWLL
jgi:hypothetical protein